MQGVVQQRGLEHGVSILSIVSNFFFWSVSFSVAVEIPNWNTGPFVLIIIVIIIGVLRESRSGEKGVLTTIGI